MRQTLVATTLKPTGFMVAWWISELSPCQPGSQGYVLVSHGFDCPGSWIFDRSRGLLSTDGRAAQEDGWTGDDGTMIRYAKQKQLL